MCREHPDLSLNDGTFKIFFNTAGTRGSIGQDAKNILKFIKNNKSEDDFTEKLAQEVQKIKENKEWQVEYMTLLMREREKYKEGIAEGRANGIIEFALDIGYTNEEILSTLRKKLSIDVGQEEEYLKRYYAESR